ncbi:prestalk protein [Patella vulgata]|uniref:prestalk protein n=1 Tax=Patella vulgata TaxID=6465 RepID=UPI00217FEBE4|nr:prestalk protein [Patella vulgata]
MLFVVILALFPLAIQAGTDTPCEVEGVSHAHNTTFTTTASGPCIIYKCDNGGYGPESQQCMYSDGECYNEGVSKTSGCVTQTCEKRNGFIGFYITKDGCLNGNDCLDVGESVVENCNNKTCVRTDTTYSLETTYNCLGNDNICRPIGYVQESQGGCIKQTCESRSGYIGFYIRQMDCSYDGGCLAMNATDKQGCVTRKCVLNADGSFGVVIDSVECLDGDVCRPIGYVRSSNNGCFEDTCEHTGTSYGFRSTKRECNVNGGCVAVGDTRTEGCVTRTCVLGSTSIGMEMTSEECPDSDGSCVAFGTEKQSASGCIKYTCEKRTEGSGFFLTQEGCSYDGTCLDVGGTMTDSCITRKCVKEGNSLSVQIDSIGCSDEGVCREVNFSRTTNCFTYTCQNTNGQIGMAITKRECTDSNGNCHPEGYVLNTGQCNTAVCETRPTGTGFYNTPPQCQFNGDCVAVNASSTQSCITRQCQLNGNAIGMAITQVQCRDSNNNCHDLGHQITQGCFEYTCEHRVTGLGYFLTKEGCMDGTICRDYGYSRTNPPGSCLKQTCEKRPEGVGFFNEEPKCKDSDGTCKPLDATRTLANGCIVQTCITSNLGTGFQTTTEGCDNGGVCVSLNEYAPVSDCTTKQCQKQSNGAIGLVVTELKCTDNGGNCHTPGGATFSYAFDDGTVSDNCSCTANVANITRKYTCV